MSLVPEDLVEETWREVASYSGDEISLVMEKAGKRQPALLAYVMAETAESRPDVRELAVYLYIVILRMFDKMPAHKLKRVPIGKIERMSGQNEDWLDRLRSAHERFVERTAEIASETQPNVLRYLLEAIFEPEDPSLELTEEEQGLVFLVLKTTLDLLDGACKKKRF